MTAFGWLKRGSFLILALLCSLHISASGAALAAGATSAAGAASAAGPASAAGAASDDTSSDDITGENGASQTGTSLQLLFERPDGRSPCGWTLDLDKARILVNGRREIPCGAFQETQKGLYETEIPRILNADGEMLIEAPLDLPDCFDCGEPWGVWYAEDAESLCLTQSCPSRSLTHPALVIGERKSDSWNSLPTDLSGRKTLPHILTAAEARFMAPQHLQNFCGEIPESFWRAWPGTEIMEFLILEASCLTGLPDREAALRPGLILDFRNNDIASLPGWVRGSCVPGATTEGMFFYLPGNPVTDGPDADLFDKRGGLYIPPCSAPGTGLLPALTGK